MWTQETMRRRAARSEGGSRSRRKRFLSYPRFVELMVTADAKMVRHHGRNLEHYILTIMSVVSKLPLHSLSRLGVIENRSLNGFSASSVVHSIPHVCV